MNSDLFRLYGRTFETNDGKPPPGVRNAPCLGFRSEPMSEADCHEAMLEAQQAPDGGKFEFCIVEADAEPVFGS